MGWRRNVDGKVREGNGMRIWLAISSTALALSLGKSLPAQQLDISGPFGSGAFGSKIVVQSFFRTGTLWSQI